MYDAEWYLRGRSDVGNLRNISFNIKHLFYDKSVLILSFWNFAQSMAV